MAPTIFSPPIAMGANYSVEFFSIVHWVPQFFMHNKSILGGVKEKLPKLKIGFFPEILWGFRKS